MIEYYTGSEEQCLAIDTIISTNCGWSDGKTKNWDNPRETTVSGVYSISVPQGSHGFTKEKMNEGVTSDITTDVEFPQTEM